MKSQNRSAKSVRQSRAKRRARTPIRPHAIVPREDASMLANLLDESSLVAYDTALVDQQPRVSLSLVTGFVAASLVTLAATLR